MTQTELARRVRVATNTAWGWEAHGAIPRSAETRAAVADGHVGLRLLTEALPNWEWPLKGG